MDETKVEVSLAALRALYNSLSGEDKKKMEAHYPDLCRPLDLSVPIFYEDPKTKMEIAGIRLIDARTGGEYGGKGFFLNSDFTWELKNDMAGVLVLIPTVHPWNTPLQDRLHTYRNRFLKGEK